RQPRLERGRPRRHAEPQDEERGDEGGEEHRLGPDEEQNRHPEIVEGATGRGLRAVVVAAAAGRWGWRPHVAGRRPDDRGTRGGGCEQLGRHAHHLMPARIVATTRARTMVSNTRTVRRFRSSRPRPDGSTRRGPALMVLTPCRRPRGRGALAGTRRTRA